MQTIGQILDAAANRQLTHSEVTALRNAFTFKGSSKPKMDPLRRARWYKMAALWDGPARKVMDMDGQGILLQGTMHDDELAVCLVPPAIGPTQGDTLRMLLQANLRMPCLVLTNNIHLCKLVPVTEAVAREIMQKAVGEDGQQKVEDISPPVAEGHDEADRLEAETDGEEEDGELQCPPEWADHPECRNEETGEHCPRLEQCERDQTADGEE